jgi:hypothetical protein
MTMFFLEICMAPMSSSADIMIAGTKLRERLSRLLAGDDDDLVSSSAVIPRPAAGLLANAKRILPSLVAHRMNIRFQIRLIAELKLGIFPMVRGDRGHLYGGEIDGFAVCEQ